MAGKKQKGQSTIEFLLSFVFSLGFLFLFVQLALNAGIGFLAQYATFMAARTYLVAEDNGAVVRNNLNFVNTDIARIMNEIYDLDYYGVDTSRIQINTPPVSGESNAGFIYEYVGVWMPFERTFSPLPIVGGDTPLKLVTEAFLGKEPTRATCARRICDYSFSNVIGYSCNFGSTNSNHITIFDNGC